ncbi:MAG: UvrD-helicase domain-containing protein, partial [Bacilli bacterium]
MAFKWSINQCKAINDIGKNILVSAGAGSGKTAVLTERIFQLVKKGYPISRFLVLTFTNAAAAEMKSRIRDKLLDDKDFYNSLSDLEAAHIETFDAFALFIVKKYASSINLSSDISIMDSSILNIQKNKIRDEVFDEFYREHDSLFVETIKAYCLKDDKEIKEYINKIIACADLQIDKASFYQSLVNQTYQEKIIISYLDDYYHQIITTFSELMKRAEELSNIDDSERICRLLEQLIRCRNYDELYDTIQQSTFPRKPKGYPAEDEQIRFDIASAFKEIKNNNFGRSQDVINLFLANKATAELFMKMARLVDERFTRYKEEHQSYDFSDIARMALTILAIPNIGDEVKRSFDFIMVDEYQDTSDIQEKVIAFLDRDNVYMVGDVKQSIYRFRNANCHIFQKKFIDYKAGHGGEEIDLNQSFRSRREIVDFINDLFGQIMTPENNIINYQDGHHFVFKPSVYQDFADHRDSYIPHVYRYIAKKSLDNVEQEMAIIADDILDKIHQHYQVYDKNLDGQPMRDCTYRDFAIIMDRGTEFDNYHRYFSKKGIPLHVVNDETINDS